MIWMNTVVLFLWIKTGQTEDSRQVLVQFNDQTVISVNSKLTGIPIILLSHP